MIDAVAASVRQKLTHAAAHTQRAPHLPRAVQQAIARRLHSTVADLIVAGCETIRQRHGLHQVGLSGGVFQNATLLAAAPQVNALRDPTRGGLASSLNEIAAAPGSLTSKSANSCPESVDRAIANIGAQNHAPPRSGSPIQTAQRVS